MATALDAGKSMLSGILAKLPESVRASVQQAFEAPEAADALTTLGDSTLARSDYSRQMDDLRAKESTLQQDYENLQAWYETNKGTLARAGELEAEVQRLKGSPAAPPLRSTPAGPDPASFEKELAARERQAALYLNAVSKLGLEHFQRFNEVLDPNELMTLAEQRKVSIFDAYQLKFGDKLQAKRTEEEQARINKIVEERLADERKKTEGQPFPLRHQAPSVLDVLDTKDGPAQHTVDTAVSLYEALNAARG